MKTEHEVRGPKTSEHEARGSNIYIGARSA